MARLRSYVVQFPAFAVAVLALALSLGGGAGYVASAAANQPAVIAFHPLKLINGWSNYTAHVGAPSYEIRNGVVYLSGGMRRASGNNNVFAVLPRGARPSHGLWIGVYSEATTTTYLNIEPSGAMYMGGTNTATFASLAGVSFVVGA
jgi:hypothetical protein